MSLTQSLADCLPAAWDRVAVLAGDDNFRHLRARLKGSGRLDEVERLMAVSPFFVEQLAQNADWVADNVATDWLEDRSWSHDDWRRALALFTAGADDEAGFMAALRRFRSREMLRIVWRDFSGSANLAATVADVSRLADTTIEAAVEWAGQGLTPRFGHPVGRDTGSVQELIVLGMGKLGGEELNLSSDIDLIFTYPEAGQTEGGRTSVSNQEYFIKLGQGVIRFLDTVTANGFVFRVDMRLRPYGDSGALVSSFDALELYYQEQGREWERYALMKARPITGHPDAVAPLNEMIQAFVFRRYTDFGVIESLRDMKAMILAEIRRQGLSDNIKKGEGGIREIEFIAQCLQLIHGGRDRTLQLRGLEPALESIRTAQLLPSDVVDELISAYRWLRDCEHALQGMEDRQTQTLPVEPLSRERVATIMGLPNWSALVEVLNRHRDAVARHFAELIAPAQHSISNEDTLQFATLGLASLTELNFDSPSDSWGLIERYLSSARFQVLQGDSRQRVERFLPRLCEAAAQSSAPGRVLERLLPFVEAVSRRSAYLVLLEENPQALAQLVLLAAKSPWIADRLAKRPDLLDELLDIDRLTSAPDRSAIQSLVRQQLLRVPEEDLEAQMLALGRIKDSVVLRVAASELTDHLPLMKVSDYLTFLAEVIVEQAIHVARAELVKRHGQPQGKRTGFAVLGYGKLGGIELSYGSDLDLVFVYEGDDGETDGPRPIDNVRFFTRLAQRVTHVLSTKMAAGRLYEVDLRLRPHGDSGLVAVSVTGLRKYQLESAWTWEHQALVRTRALAGDSHLTRTLAELRKEVLCLARDSTTLIEDVVSMRRRMLKAGTQKIDVPRGCFDLKRDPGGIVDIEFVVQYLVLEHARTIPALTEWSDVVRIIESLQQHAVLPEQDAGGLVDAYLAFRSAVHTTALQGEQAVGRTADFEQHLKHVIAVRERLLPGITDELPS